MPILIKLNERHISFGSDNPQLCFLFMLTPREGDRRVPTYLCQRFAFNLSWSPEDLKEVPQTTEELVDSGELEMF